MLMKEFKRDIVVTEQEWQKCLKDEADRIRRYNNETWVAEGLNPPEHELHFLSTGDIKQYLEEAVASGDGASFGEVLACNPSRNFENLLHNIQYYWDWVLADPLGRLPFEIGGRTKVDKQDYFYNAMSRLGGNASFVLDPLCSAKLFLLTFGERFESERTFPLVFGPDRWQPVLKPDPEQKFLGIMIALESYLFGTDFKIANRQCLILLDYWFSTIPFLSDLRIFDLPLHVDIRFPDRTKLSQKQKAVRNLLAGLNGYVAYEERGNTLAHNDPELEEYVRERLAAMNMPPEYHRLVEFVNEHKENCLDPFDEA